MPSTPLVDVTQDVFKGSLAVEEWRWHRVRGWLLAGDVLVPETVDDRKCVLEIPDPVLSWLKIATGNRSWSKPSEFLRFSENFPSISDGFPKVFPPPRDS